jgi:predicted membrane GTPase involved in stress response
VDHPISSTVTRPAEKSQRAFAVAASRYVEAIERVSADVTDEGLVVRGLTELDVELAVHEIKEHFVDVLCGKPEVVYRMGPSLMEPYYRAIIDTPEECWGLVMADMSNRRGLIQSIRESPIGKRVCRFGPGFGVFRVRHSVTVSDSRTRSIFRGVFALRAGRGR